MRNILLIGGGGLAIASAAGLIHFKHGIWIGGALVLAGFFFFPTTTDTGTA